MSITFELRGQRNQAWPLSTMSLGQINRLRETAAHSVVDIIFGDEHLLAGTARTVNTQLLLKAVDRLQPIAKKLPGGFEVLVPPLFPGTAPIEAPGVGGVLIGGRYHYIRCWDDYWTMQPIDEMQTGIEPLRHYAAAKVQSENMGIVNVQMSKSRHSELAALLREMSDFLKKDDSEAVLVILG
jgi:hypothetical protein